MSANPVVDFVPDGVGRPGFAEREDIDAFVDMLERFENGDISPDEWRAFRLINGTYGQRQEGVFMIRVKLPYGLANSKQLQTFAEVTEKWAGSGVGHVTTRQNIQLHFVKEKEAELALSQMADVGLTTREACGNAVRNITGCPFAGVAPTELFDVSPYADAVTRHLLRGPYSSALPRKFKIAFGGCCGFDDIQAQINDLGFLTAVDAQGNHGFKVYMGGGLSTLRKAGILVHEFLPVTEVLEVSEAVVRTFHRLGNRKDKHKARLKWAIQKLGTAAFIEEYKKDLAEVRAEGGRPLAVAPAPKPRAVPEAGTTVEPTGGARGVPKTNVRGQKQAGFSSVIVRLPKGDITPAQFRALALLADEFGEGEIRTTNEQNLVMRFVPTWRVAELHRELTAAGLGQAGAMTMADVLSCPGASSCKIAVTNSKAIGAMLTDHLDARPDLVAQVPGLDVKISGCPERLRPALQLGDRAARRDAQDRRQAGAAVLRLRRRRLRRGRPEVRAHRGQSPGAARAAGPRASGRDVQRREAAGRDAAGVLHTDRDGQSGGQDQGSDRDGRHDGDGGRLHRPRREQGLRAGRDGRRVRRLSVADAFATGGLS